MQRNVTGTAVLGLAFSWTPDARSECFADNSYKACSETETSSNGDMRTRSWDTESNSYHVDVKTRQQDNTQITTSFDSEGNEYSIKSWADSSVSHMTDSEGN